MSWRKFSCFSTCPSMLPVPNCFQHATSFLGVYQHLHLSSSPSKCVTLQTGLFIICFFCSPFIFLVDNFFLSINNVLPIAVLARLSLVAYLSSDVLLLNIWTGLLAQLADTLLIDTLYCYFSMIYTSPLFSSYSFLLHKQLC